VNPLFPFEGDNWGGMPILPKILVAYHAGHWLGISTLLVPEPAPYCS